jgi:acetyl-CoA acetyltransferase
MTGQAKYVACVATGQRLAAYRGRFTGAALHGNSESHREGGGPHLESPPYGLISVGGGAAMSMRRYFEKYGGDEQMLGAVAVAQRQWAQTNPDAYFHGNPLTIERYLAEPYIVEPLRTFDHCIPGNTAFCIIVTTADRAKDCRFEPIYISGLQGSQSGRESFIFGRTGLGVGQQTEGPYKPPRMPIYDMAGVAPKDIQILGALDAFSPVVLFILEEFGFCGEGEALHWVQRGRTAPGGELPVNTCGGGLSDMESYGWGHQVDMVRHMRGQAGGGQIPDVRVCQYASLDHCSIILTRR